MLLNRTHGAIKYGAIWRAFLALIVTMLRISYPFIDGNGRKGRLIRSLDLISNGYPPINVEFTDRKCYYDAFDAYYCDGNAKAMGELIVEYVYIWIDDYFDILSR